MSMLIERETSAGSEGGICPASRGNKNGVTSG